MADDPYAQYAVDPYAQYAVDAPKPAAQPNTINSLETQRLQQGVADFPNVAPRDAPDQASVRMFGRAASQVPARIGMGIVQGGAALADAGARVGNALSSNVTGDPTQRYATDNTAAISRRFDPSMQTLDSELYPSDPKTGHVLGQLVAGAATIPIMGALGSADTLTGALVKNALAGGLASDMTYEQGADFSQKLKEAEKAAAVTGALSVANPGAWFAASKNYFSQKLNEIAANASARVQARVADLPDLVGEQNVTIQHVLQSPTADRVAAAAAGSQTREAQAVLDDAAVAGYQKKAEAMSAQAVKAPDLAQGVSNALEARDVDLTARGKAAYKAGEARVQVAQAQAPNQQMPFPELTKAADEIKKELGDIYNLDPAKLGTRTEELLNFLKLNVMPAQPLIGEAGASIIRTTPMEAMKLSKGINTLYTDTNKVLPTKEVVDVNGVYSRLKSAYERDLAAMPDSPAAQAIKDTNAAYQRVQGYRQQLRASAVNGAFGKDAIGDPEAMLDRLVGMNPSAAAYARKTLEAYNPDALQGIKRFALERQIHNAMVPGGAGQAGSEFDVNKLDPGSLLKSGLYTKSEVAELQKAANALALINASRATAFASGTPQAKELGRVAASLNPTFVSGIVAHKLGTGHIERLLTTPEGRRLLTDVFSTSKATGTAARIAVARIMIGQMGDTSPDQQDQQPPQQ